MSKSSNYQPPYTITPAIMNLVAEIGEIIGCYTMPTSRRGKLSTNSRHGLRRERPTASPIKYRSNTDQIVSPVYSHVWRV